MKWAVSLRCEKKYPLQSPAAVIAAAWVTVSLLDAPAACQTSIEESPDLMALAHQKPNCKEFRNNCQVCIQLPDGKLGCSNIGVACNPNGSWRCSVPGTSEERK
jgi:hypothetical protein